MVEHLIIGAGDVGAALGKVLSEKYKVQLWDPGLDDRVADLDACEVLHLCFPYSDRFLSWAHAYIEFCNPSLTIVHSTVPVGTTEWIGEEVVHSPVRGMHPDLAEGIRTFVKYFGGPRANDAGTYFDGLCHWRPYPSARITEAIKLWSTTQYGLQILIQKEIKAWCDECGLPFETVYQMANADYNEGYRKLGKPNVVRPWLYHVPGGIGGGCILENAGMLDNWLAELLLERNEEWKDE